MIVSGVACRDVELVTAALDLSLWSSAFGPALFLIPHYNCFRTCMSARWTCQPSIGLVILELDLHVGIVDLSPQDWTCQFWSCARHQIRNVSGLACWDIRLVTAALDLACRSWALGPASFLTLIMFRLTNFDDNQRQSLRIRLNPDNNPILY